MYFVVDVEEGLGYDSTGTEDEKKEQLLTGTEDEKKEQLLSGTEDEREEQREEQLLFG